MVLRQKKSMFQSIFRKIIRGRSKVVISRVLPYLKNTKKIIDIGSGTGDVALLLKQQGKNVTPVDVIGFHGPRLLKPIIYDGQKLPFPDKSFEVALLLMVLHHTPDPNLVFSEAARVAKEIVVIETSYTTPINKRLTVFFDALNNLDIKPSWSSYKSDDEWKKFFSNKDMKIISTQKYHDRNFGLPFLHIAYHLQQK